MNYGTTSELFMKIIVGFKMVVIGKVDIMFHILVKILLSQNCSFQSETKQTYEPLCIVLYTCEAPFETTKGRILKTELTDECFMEQKNLNIVNVHKFSFVEIVNIEH